MIVVGKIVSNSSVASQVSASMSQAANTLAAINTQPSEAGGTTVNGNTNAKNSIQKANQSVKRLVAAFNKDIDNVHTVAKEFERVDQVIQQKVAALDPFSGLKGRG
nr:TIGR04197 family type VII secretion effector [Enterococcus rivorum]